ncbi:MAG TPA: hypothetical protein VFE20_03710 [Thermoleophilia bacterium]|nr:hypothetical protein [Thermoleophilia bacterium]
MTRSRALLPILLLLLVAVLSLGPAGCGDDESEATAHNTEGLASAAGDDATATGGANLVREDFSLESYRGKPLLLNFWASW